VFEFIIIVESAADFRTAKTIAERLVTERLPWFEEYLSGVFSWTGLQENSQFSCWRDIEKIRQEIESQGVRVPRILGKPELRKYDGASARKVLKIITSLQKHRGNRDIKAVLSQYLDTRKPGSRKSMLAEHTFGCFAGARPADRFDCVYRSD